MFSYPFPYNNYFALIQNNYCGIDTRRKIFSEIYVEVYQDIAPSFIPSVQGSSYPANTGAVKNVLKKKTPIISFFMFLISKFIYSSTSCSEFFK